MKLDLEDVACGDFNLLHDGIPVLHPVTGGRLEFTSKGGRVSTQKILQRLEPNGSTTSASGPAIRPS